MHQQHGRLSQEQIIVIKQYIRENHGKGSSNALVAIYNAANLLIIPPSVDTTSNNTTVITFENPEIGRAVLTFVI